MALVTHVTGRPRVSTNMQMPRMQRGIRRPTHNWNVKNPPFTFQPVMCAPVWPGETLKSARWKARAITDPILGRLVGWWLEYYLFYVPMSATKSADTNKAMLLDATAEVHSNVTRSAVNYLKDDGSVESTDWMTECLDPIIERWFREEGETTDTAYFGAGAPPGDDKWYKVKCEAPGWTDSYRSDTTDAADDITLVDEAGSGTLTASELDQQMRLWELARMQGLTTQSYEEFLMSYRVNVPQEPGVGEVELLRYARLFQYPSNTVVPTTGAVTSAVSWSVDQSADKDRFFREPGFLIMGTCARPKVYFTKQTSFAASQMSDAFAWLPATLWEDPRLGLRRLITDQMVKDSGPCVFDIRDLAMYGDQYVSHLASTGMNPVNLPDTSENVKWIADADIKAMFVTSASAYYVEQDGHCELTVASSVKDPEPVRSGV